MIEVIRPAIPARPQSIFLYQEGWHLLGHGKLCPWCKEFTMIYTDMELVYRIPRSTSESTKAVYHKLNWDWVCGQECAMAMRQSWFSGAMARDRLKERILETSQPRPIAKKLSDSYREMVLKLCRIDPSIDIQTEVFRGWDFLQYHLDN
jgi:hypothetical protein